jgi:hypothetical protein
MNTIFSTINALTLAVSASLICATAYAAQQPTDASSQAAATIATSPTVQQMTRKQVYEQLVQSEKDGSLACFDATYAGG